MKRTFITSALLAFCLTFAINTVLLAQTSVSGKMRDEVEEAQDAAHVFEQIMNAPDSGIPQSVLDRANCIAVFPNVLKAGFIFGARGGSGLASCRTANGWSAPAYLSLAGGSFGLQIGAQSTDFVLLFMTSDGINTLLKNKFTLGADASVAAGPVGREAGASTDLALNAQILSYSRSKGLFAGLELKGVVIKPDKGDMRDVYGSDITAREVLYDRRGYAPMPMQVFPETLARYSSTMAQR